MREGDLAAFSASTSGTTTPVDDGSADIGVHFAVTLNPSPPATPINNGPTEPLVCSLP